jgi:hypothetical protein
LRPSFFYDTAEEDEKSNGCALPADLFLPEEAAENEKTGMHRPDDDSGLFIPSAQILIVCMMQSPDLYH